MNESSAVALLLLTGGAIVGTYLWRGAGVMFAARIKSDSPVFQWVTFVSYAMLGGLIARMVILPIGPLMETPLLCRALAFVIGVGGVLWWWQKGPARSLFGCRNVHSSRIIFLIHNGVSQYASNESPVK